MLFYHRWCAKKAQELTLKKQWQCPLQERESDKTSRSWVDDTNTNLLDKVGYLLSISNEKFSSNAQYA